MKNKFRASLITMALSSGLIVATGFASATMAWNGNRTNNNYPRYNNEQQQVYVYNGQNYRYRHEGAYYNYYSNGRYYNYCTIRPAHWSYGYWYPSEEYCW
jgi:hypothetical protein